MAEEDRLRQRYLDAFFGAWPEHTITRAEASETLSVAVDRDADEPTVVVKFGYMGSETHVGFDGSDAGLLQAIDEMARTNADDAEGDRWIAGEGWREYEP